MSGAENPVGLSRYDPRFSQGGSPLSSESTIRYFSLARHALAAALKACNIGVGNTILLPSFLCRDLLASLSQVGAEPRWYPVGTDLLPARNDEEWPTAKAVVAVNYFGFPQSLAPFRRYTERTGAILIEDNAHGFLSRDVDGQWLGTRGDMGLFSLRKTLPILDGAALWVKDGNRFVLDAPLQPAGPGYAPSVVRKTRLRHAPLGGLLTGLATQAARTLRKLRTGHAIPPPSPEAEREIPHGPAPYAELMTALDALDADKEIERRRSLYRQVDQVARSLGVAPVFETLPDNTAPYGYPFRAESPAQAARLTRWAERRGLDVFAWPDLPDALAASAPAHYRNLYLVNFLW